MCKVDFIIVGQGLAGTVLALTLSNHSKSFVIIDNNSPTASSFAAAGISHPISFKRLILSWQAEKLIPFSKKFYQETYRLIKELTFKEQEMIRFFSSFEEQNNWMIKAADDRFAKFLKRSTSSFKSYNINEPFGNGKVSQASRLNVSRFVRLTRNYFISQNKLINHSFEYDKLSISKSSCQYQNITAKKIIFCEGPSVKTNPFFNYLPFGLNKGVVLTISTKELPKKLLSKGCFVVPTENENEYIVGSTYDHKNLSLEDQKSGKEELLTKLSQLGTFKYKVISQKSGIRPSTIDRRPIIGEHPLIKNMYLFNGLGSKGVMLAPFYANQLINSIEHNDKIEKEVSINRFNKTYLSKNKIK